MPVAVHETHANPKQQWRKVGETAAGLPIWQHDDSTLAVERDFERLCELTPAEVAQLEAQGDAA